MGKFHISVVVGVANVYPKGMSGDGVVLWAGDKPLTFVTRNKDNPAQEDFVAPAAWCC
jgi:hypothetical protein